MTRISGHAREVEVASFGSINAALDGVLDSLDAERSWNRIEDITPLVHEQHANVLRRAALLMPSEQVYPCQTSSRVDADAVRGPAG